MAEYLENAVQAVAINQPAIFSASIPCRKGYVYHEDGTGIFILRGIVNNPSACFARYQVTFNGNVAIPQGGTVAPIAVALAVNGEPRMTSRAIYVPAAAGDGNYGNVTSTAIITVPRGCCFSVSLRSVAASEDPTVTPAPVINLQNANLVITRVA
jgi:hypothetical protein